MRFIIIAILAMLSACGGGDQEPEKITCDVVGTTIISPSGGVLGAAMGAVAASGEHCKP
jgi:hypothetical protein